MKPLMKAAVKRGGTLILIGALLSPISYAFEFDNKILESLGFENVDLSAFAGSNDQFTGKYLADIVINEQNIFYNYPVYLYSEEGQSYICYTDELLTSLPISKELRVGAKKTLVNSTDAGECYGLEQYDSAIAAEFDDREQKIKIRMPHAYLVDFDPYWVPPNQRDYGISGLFLDYNLLKTYNRYKGSDGGHYSSNHFSSYGVIGFNLGRFRFRTNYQYSPNNVKKFERTQTYGFTDIGALNAHLYAGELYSRSNLFSSVRFKGVSLYTEESMMPNYLQGYAPQVTGTATSNAVVTVRQYGNIIKQVQVPPGPFAIANLPSYLSGTVDVTVEESDGSINEFQVEIAHVPYLTRKGALRYNLNAGKLAPQNNSHKIDVKFASADGSYGLTDMISLIGGLTYTTNNEYVAYNAGLGLNLGIVGALSFDITKSENKANPGRRLTGQSYRFNYAKRFGENTSLNIVGYRFSSRDYTTLSNYVDMKTGRDNRIYLEKNRFSLSVSQYVPQWNISVAATASKSTYWNQESNSYYNLSFYKTIERGWFQNSSVSLNFTHNKSNYGAKDDLVGVYVSIPLEDRKSRLSYNARYERSRKNVSQQAVFYSEGMGGNYSLGAAMNHKHDLSGSVDYALSASYNTTLSFGNFNGSVSYASDQQNVTAGFSGSLTLTEHGLATHPYVFEEGSRLIIDAGVPGVEMQGNSSKSNIFGLAGISNISNYYRSTYLIDNDNLPNNVEIQDGVMEVAPTKGAIAYRSANAISGEKALVTITLPDGSHPPFGAIVYRENGKGSEVGMVADQGRTYLTGLNKKAEFVVKWGRDQSCTLPIRSTDSNDLTNIICH
ncbi:fimbria/pilus outer membrane usher protein [Ignatzschineria cameli]|uniref:Fimbrial biogenesis outer membrane usher protein n=1 Tax=Ignatzschineria cameli TaxID=2182793 RepID=A0A2U2AT33_9GAMM|nr:fimbria/pilus outer membrane usher protein [Ignatzschineria cameli]PWD87785.1 hypothetical protein DC077_00425 [Ignatzschineria cameli]